MKPAVPVVAVGQRPPWLRGKGVLQVELRRKRGSSSHRCHWHRNCHKWPPGYFGTTRDRNVSPLSSRCLDIERDRPGCSACSAASRVPVSHMIPADSLQSTWLAISLAIDVVADGFYCISTLVRIHCGLCRCCESKRKKQEAMVHSRTPFWVLFFSRSHGPPVQAFGRRKVD